MLLRLYRPSSPFLLSLHPYPNSHLIPLPLDPSLTLLLHLNCHLSFSLALMYQSGKYCTSILLNYLSERYRGDLCGTKFLHTFPDLLWEFSVVSVPAMAIDSMVKYGWGLWTGKKRQILRCNSIVTKYRSKTLGETKCAVRVAWLQESTLQILSQAFWVFNMSNSELELVHAAAMKEVSLSSVGKELDIFTFLLRSIAIWMESWE